MRYGLWLFTWGGDTLAREPFTPSFVEGRNEPKRVGSNDVASSEALIGSEASQCKRALCLLAVTAATAVVTSVGAAPK